MLDKLFSDVAGSEHVVRLHDCSHEDVEVLLRYVYRRNKRELAKMLSTERLIALAHMADKLDVQDALALCDRVSSSFVRYPFTAACTPLEKVLAVGGVRGASAANLLHFGFSYSITINRL